MKRFSDTKRFDEAWYSDLSLEHKIAYEYVWARADNAGVWSPNFKLGDFQIGKKIDWQGLPKKSGDRIRILPSGSWALVGFVETQCGVLSSLCRPHMVVISLLRSHGLLVGDSLCIEYPKGSDTLKDKDKYTEQEEDQKRKGSAEGSAEGKPKEGYVVPSCFEQTDGFTSALGGWIDQRKRLGKDPTPFSIQLVINKLALRPAEAVAALHMAAEKAWTGFEWKWVDNSNTDLFRNGRNGTHKTGAMPPVHDPNDNEL